jgi:hypothetical protein
MATSFLLTTPIIVGIDGANIKEPNLTYIRAVMHQTITSVHSVLKIFGCWLLSFGTYRSRRYAFTTCRFLNFFVNLFVDNHVHTLFISCRDTACPFFCPLNCPPLASIISYSANSSSAIASPSPSVATSTQSKYALCFTPNTIRRNCLDNST